MTHRRIRIISIILAVALVNAALVVNIVVLVAKFDRLDTQLTITSTLRKYAIRPTLFTNGNQIEGYRDGPVSFTGDERLVGIYRLNGNQAQELYSSSHMLKCDAANNCTFTNQSFKHDAYRCEYAQKTDHEMGLDLCVDTIKDVVEWSYTFY